jgi:hypothetical protein
MQFVLRTQFVSRIGPLNSQMSYTLNLVSVAIQEYSDINTQSRAMKQQQTVINFPDHAICRPSPPPPSVSKHSCGNIYIIVGLNRYNTHIIYIRMAVAATVLFPWRPDYLPETIICWRDYRLLQRLRYNLYVCNTLIYLCVYIYYIILYYMCMYYVNV